MGVYGSALFFPHDQSLDKREKVMAKKRKYIETSRTISKTVVFMDAHTLRSDHTVQLPVGMAVKKIAAAGRVMENQRFNRKWDSEEIRTFIQSFSPFPLFHFLRPVRKSLGVCKATNVSCDLLMKAFNRSKNIYILEVSVQVRTCVTLVAL